MKKSTVLSLTTAAVILAAYVPNEVILADTPSSEDSLKISDKETVIGNQNENKEKLEDIHNAIETSKDTEEKKTTIIEEKEVVSKESVIDNKTSNEEEKIKEDTQATSRCIPFEQEQIADTCICCGKPAVKMVYWGKAY